MYTEPKSAHSLSAWCGELAAMGYDVPYRGGSLVPFSHHVVMALVKKKRTTTILGQDLWLIFVCVCEMKCVAHAMGLCPLTYMLYGLDMYCMPMDLSRARASMSYDTDCVIESQFPDCGEFKIVLNQRSEKEQKQK